MMLEWKKQSAQLEKCKWLCNTAKSLLGTLKGNKQQSNEGQRKSKKQQQQTDSSDEADQY